MQNLAYSLQQSTHCHMNLKVIKTLGCHVLMKAYKELGEITLEAAQWIIGKLIHNLEKGKM